MAIKACSGDRRRDAENDQNHASWQRFSMFEHKISPQSVPFLRISRYVALRGQDCNGHLVSLCQTWGSELFPALKFFSASLIGE